mmetsp:Transcript_36457/g.66796  ORF Transcript_36457/g.66796 Transcript_36457/m.66796 type:complete len:920 (-) Transcript_36457:15-2774(-)
MAEEKTPKAERRDVLLFAAANGRSDLISYAIEEERKDSEGDVSDLLSARQPESNMTALHLACQGGFVDVVRVLLNRNAPADLLDASGCTAHDIAKKSKSASALIGAFEAELFKRVASGDSNGTAALLLGRVSPNCQQGGSSLCAWAELFEQTELATKITQIINGEITADALLPRQADNELAQSGPHPEEGAVEVVEKDELQVSPEEMEKWSSWREKALTVFPLLWPPATVCTPCGEAGSCTLPIQRVLKVQVPGELTAAGCEELMQALSATVSSCIAGYRLPALNGELHVVPYLDTAMVDAGSSPRVFFFLESQTLPQRAFQISLFPGTAGDGHIEIAASGLPGFRLAMDALRQLLVHHGELDASRGVVSMPAGTLEEGSETTRAAALYLDVWELQTEGALAALKLMQSWRVGQLFVPVPADDLAGGSNAARTLLLVQLRKACVAAGVELIPVLHISLQSALALDSNEGRESNQQLFELLPVFGPLRSLGVRVKANPPNGEQHGGHPAHEDQLLSALSKIRKVGLRHGTANLACWLSVNSLPFLRRFCNRVSTGSARGRTTVVLEVDMQRGPGNCLSSPVSSIGPAALTCRSYGLPHLVFASAGTAASTERLPAVVWPGEGVRAHASSIGSVLSASQEACARGTIVEVPVHTSPWCGPGTRFSSSWCALTALFGSSLTDPDSVLAVLDDPERQTTERGGSLGQLLAAHMLEAPCGRTEVLAVAPAFARLLWDSPVQARSASGGPSARFLPTLLQLLQGRIQGCDAKPQLVTNANAWFLHLTERQQQLLAGEQDLSSHAGTWVELTRSLLKMALQGVDWLRFLCRLLLIIIKHVPDDQLKDPSCAGTSGMRKVMKHLPPAKCSDMRNKFLSLIEQTTGTAGSGETFLSAAEALWAGGLRLGAALDLEPWAGFERRQQASE